MKLRLVPLLVMAWAVIPSLVSADMLFSLRDSLGNPVGAVYPLRQGESVSLTLFVSNIPEPGTLSMGYSLSYDKQVLALDTTDPAVNYVDANYWPVRQTNDIVPGRIDVFGSRYTSVPPFIMPALYGGPYPIGTFTFVKTAPRGRAVFIVERRWQMDEDSGVLRQADDFVLADDSLVVIDGLDPPVVVGAFTDPGDAEGDGDIDGLDLARFLDDRCSGSCPSPASAEFAGYYGY